MKEHITLSRDAIKLLISRMDEEYSERAKEKFADFILGGIFSEKEVACMLTSFCEATNVDAEHLATIAGLEEEYEAFCNNHESGMTGGLSSTEEEEFIREYFREENGIALIHHEHDYSGNSWTLYAKTQ